ncbi:hypothetical protein [Stenotrophomonas sp. MMGLT7]|uniref:hypothetical protein n=1 Tax=Stenotrophomonas sp. MMGLT7 TaxID=2901227 RepID=UPI001E3D78E9|nr:hypothetical protein [Stenotrophomonas sp. MMGLT7]MCD7098408.1 hypothetical protein [Stenotrophomonas sp. MMGLT7]
MPNTTRSAALGAALLLLAVAAPAQDKGQARKLYCWDQDGQRICSDTLPAEAVNQAREEFNARSGMRSATIERALTAEERASAAEQAAQRRMDEAAEQTRRLTDQAMLLSFQDEDELRRVFNERIGIVDNNIQTARYNVTSLREGLVALLRNAGDRELAGQKVSDKVAGDIQRRHQELLLQLRMQASFERQRAALDAEIEDALQRFRRLRGLAAAAG